MAVQGVSRRYAEAVFDLASEAGSEQPWLEALQSLAEVADDNETRAYFENPAIEDADKRTALENILPGAENSEVRNLVQMLIRRNRFDQLPGILEAYEEMMLRARGVSIADVTTAVPLSTDEHQHVATQLARIVGSEVEVRSHVNESIVGGIVARIGDQLIDGSVRTQLRDLRSSLGRR